jgi:predicted lipid carrier protein YhbT
MHADPAPLAPQPAVTDSSVPPLVRRLLRRLPPPARFAAPLRLLPEPLLRHGSAQVIAQVLTTPLMAGRLDEFAGRRIGVEVTDLQLRWVVAIGERRVAVLGPGAEAQATVRGTATDLLLLASRLEDADTLFFHRRLQLTGDVELGLALRNLLDQLPWESIPLGLRIALNRGARFAQVARAAYRDTVD